MALQQRRCHPARCPSLCSSHVNLSFADVLAARPRLRTALLWLLPRIDMVHVFSLRKHYGTALEVSESGLVTDVLEDSEGGVVTGISEVQEQNGKLWFGSVTNSHIAVLNYNV